MLQDKKILSMRRTKQKKNFVTSQERFSVSAGPFCIDDCPDTQAELPVMLATKKGRMACGREKKETSFICPLPS